MPMRWTQQFLASYWIPQVGIGNPTQNVVVPLTDVGNYVLANAAPQTNVVFLGFASFTGSPENFSPPYISIPNSLLEQLTLQAGQTQTNVQYLQSLGIKVLLSVQGYTPPNQQSGMGWDGVPASENEAFASWVKTTIIDGYGLDGIDIDNEWSGLPANPQSFMDTVSALREYLPDSLISKALWSDFQYFTCPISGSSPSTYLSSLLDFGCTMAYGYCFKQQKALVAQYQNIQIRGLNVGMKSDQLCVGVQAGPPDQSWMTPIAEVGKLATWVVQANLLGMMLFTFSQDIQQFTHSPQNSPGYMYPNANDHEWQKSIIEGMWGPSNWVVK